MAAGKRGKGGGSPRNRQIANPAAAEKLLEEATTAAEKHGVEPVSSDSGPDDESTTPEAIGTAKAAKATFLKVERTLDQKTKEYGDLIAKAEETRDELDSQRSELEVKQSELDEALTAIRERTEEVERREAALATKQAEAEAGFLERREEILGPIRERIVELTSSWHAQERQLLEDWDDKLRLRRDEIANTLAPERAELDEQRQELDRLDRQLRTERVAFDRVSRELEADQELIAEDRAELERSAAALEERVAREIERARREIDEENVRLKERVRQLEESDQILRRLRAQFQEDPVQAIRRMNELEAERQLLEEELRQRPPAAIRHELEAARHELNEARSERDGARRSVIELEGRLGRYVADLETQTQFKLTNTTLASTIEAYKQVVGELRAQFDHLTASSLTETAFPECREMDKEFDGKRPPITQHPGQLAEFVEDLQLRMSYDPQAVREGRRLNYRLSDLRIFLAGMAMSRLHLLEGVSGTGKTTLPRAFAQAIGAGCKTIEVQAGWRDRQDLLGYYNSFERVYRESECLQWLYRAQLPYYEDIPIFIILDEMNLSHPEQYFADFLSVLENPGSPISLVDRKVSDPPQHMDTTAGVQLRLPKNVWFVGTANQDETTFGFAPKTYDRSHVMDLQPDAPTVQGDAPEGRARIGLRDLEATFTDACNRHAADAETAKRFVADLEPIFKNKFRVGWGHRLNKHVERFVPVNIAAGGSLGEALDHVAASKLMKKISGRHSLRKPALEELADGVETLWPDDSHRPDATLSAIQNEIDDLG